MRRSVWWMGAWMVGMSLVGCASTDAPRLARRADPPVVADTQGMPVVGRYRSEWRTYLSHQRELQLQRLRAYTDREQYALNDSDGLRFVWRDRQGRLCAMANLVNESGRHDLVEEVASGENDLQLATVTDGPLYDWMLTSGLLQEEAQLVQEPDFSVRAAQGSKFTNPSIVDDPARSGVARPVPADPFGDTARVAWEIRRKHAHLESAIERLSMDAPDSVETALDRLGDRIDAPPPG